METETEFTYVQTFTDGKLESMLLTTIDVCILRPMRVVVA